MRLFRRRKRDATQAVEPAPAAPPPPGGWRGFGYKGAWLALPTTDAHAVAEALGLSGLRPATWEDGLAAAYERDAPTNDVFLTPPIGGWTLAVLGGRLFEDDGGGRIRLADLSRRFGESQKFATHRVVEYQEWQRWVDGAAVRRYCWVGESGEVRFDEGDPTPAEGNVLRAADVDGDWEDADLADEETVMAVAAQWSVDPTTLDERDDVPAEGFLGVLA